MDVMSRVPLGVSNGMASSEQNEHGAAQPAVPGFTSRPAIAFVSLPRHVRDGWLPAWLERLRRYAVSHGLAVTKIYVDDQTSNGSGYLGLTSDLDSRVADVVIVPSLSHLARTGTQLRSPTVLQDALAQRGAVLHEVEAARVLP